MRNEITLNALTTELQQNYGDTLAACKVVGVSLIFVNTWRKDDKKVHETLLEAEQVGTQGLISAALHRGAHGVDEDVWYRGEVVGSKKSYSDGLLQTLLKARIQEFAADRENVPQINVNIANIMPRAANYADWLTMKDQTTNRALPAPVSEEVIDAEYVEVSQAFKGIEL